MKRVTISHDPNGRHENHAKTGAVHPCCVAAGESRDEAYQLIKEVIEFYHEGVREHGEPIPEPESEADYGEI